MAPASSDTTQHSYWSARHAPAGAVRARSATASIAASTRPARSSLIPTSSPLEPPPGPASHPGQTGASLDRHQVLPLMRRITRRRLDRPTRRARMLLIRRPMPPRHDARLTRMPLRLELDATHRRDVPVLVHAPVVAVAVSDRRCEPARVVRGHARRMGSGGVHRGPPGGSVVAAKGPASVNERNENYERVERYEIAPPNRANRAGKIRVWPRSSSPPVKRPSNSGSTGGRSRRGGQTARSRPPSPRQVVTRAGTWRTCGGRSRSGGARETSEARVAIPWPRARLDRRSGHDPTTPAGWRP